MRPCNPQAKLAHQTLWRTMMKAHANKLDLSSNTNSHFFMTNAIQFYQPDWMLVRPAEAHMQNICQYTCSDERWCHFSHVHALATNSSLNDNTCSLWPLVM